MPTPMFLVFVATILAGSLGALHYLVVHIIMGRPFGDEGTRGPARGDAAPPPAPDEEAGAGGTRHG